MSTLPDYEFSYRRPQVAKRENPYSDAFLIEYQKEVVFQRDFIDEFAPLKSAPRKEKVLEKPSLVKRHMSKEERKAFHKPADDNGRDSESVPLRDVLELV